MKRHWTARVVWVGDDDRELTDELAGIERRAGGRADELMDGLAGWRCGRTDDGPNKPEFSNRDTY